MASRSIFDPDVPAGAYDEFLPEALPRAQAQRPWTPADGPLPAHRPVPVADGDVIHLGAWTTITLTSTP